MRLSFPPPAFSCPFPLLHIPLVLFFFPALQESLQAGTFILQGLLLISSGFHQISIFFLAFFWDQVDHEAQQKIHPRNKGHKPGTTY